MIFIIPRWCAAKENGTFDGMGGTGASLMEDHVCGYEGAFGKSDDTVEGSLGAGFRVLLDEVPGFGRAIVIEVQFSKLAHEVLGGFDVWGCLGGCGR